MKLQKTTDSELTTSQDPYSLDRLCRVTDKTRNVRTGTLGLAPSLALCFHLATKQRDFELSDNDSGEVLLSCENGQLKFFDAFLAPYYFGLGKTIDLHTQYFTDMQHSNQKEAHALAQQALINQMQAYYLETIDSLKQEVSRLRSHQAELQAQLQSPEQQTALPAPAEPGPAQN